MWSIVQCAVQGRSHIKSDTPCQDKTYYTINNNVMVSALADGAGSAKLSHLGAEHITKYICEELAENFDSYFENDDGVAVKKELDEKIKNQIDSLAAELDCEPKDLASTLLVAAVNEDSYVLIHIGDGVIGYTKDNQIKIASHPENGEFVNTTVFTTSKDSLKTMKLIKGTLGAIDGFVLMSDGTEVSLYDKREKKLADVLVRIMDMLCIIDSKGVEKKLFDSFNSVIKNATTDDCSISIMKNNSNESKGFLALDDSDKMQILNLKKVSNSSKKQLQRYSQILVMLCNPQSLKSLSKKIHLKPKYLRSKIDYLCSLNFIDNNHEVFRTILKM